MSRHRNTDALANNRYYSNAYGRFMTPDPYMASARPMDPGSWNRYNYGVGDPANRNDPTGLDPVCSIWDGQYICVDTVWGEDVPNQTSFPGPFSSLDSWAQWYVQQGINSLSNIVQSVQKTYTDVQPCSFTASQVISYIGSNFTQFGNFTTTGPGGIPENVTFSPPAGPLTAGESIPVTVQVGESYTLNTSVTVASVTNNSITFNTVPGHLLYPGTITFSATDIGSGAFTFDIDLAGQLSGLANIGVFYSGGGQFEDAQWNHFLAQIGVLCGQLPITPGG